MAKRTSKSAARKPRARRSSKHRLPKRRFAELAQLLSAPEPDASAAFDFDHELCQTVWPEEAARGFGKLSLPRRRFLACFMLEAEVNNGGFMQFFDNQGPAVAREALKFLETRGLRRTAALLRRGIKAFPGGTLPRTREQIGSITLADFRSDGSPGPIGRKFDKLNSSFYDGDHARELILARLRFAHENPRHFFA